MCLYKSLFPGHPKTTGRGKGLKGEEEEVSRLPILQGRQDSPRQRT